MAQVQVKRNDTGAVLDGGTFTAAGSCLQDAIDWAVANVMGTFVGFGGLTFSCQGDLGTAEMDRAAWTTSPTALAPVIYEADAEYWHNGTFDDLTDGAYIDVSGAGNGLRIEEPYVTVRGLRVNCKGGGQQSGIVFDSRFADYGTVDRCIVDLAFTHAHSIGIRFGDQGWGSHQTIVTFHAIATGNIIRATGATDYLYCLLFKAPQSAHPSNEYNTVLDVVANHNTVHHAFEPVSGALSGGGHGIVFNPDASNATGYARVNVSELYNNVSINEGTTGSAAWDYLNAADKDGTTQLYISDATNNADNDGSIATYVNAIADSGSMEGSVTPVVPATAFTSATDYRLLAGSALIGTGSASATMTTDAAELAFKSPPSIGAFEYYASGGGMLISSRRRNRVRVL